MVNYQNGKIYRMIVGGNSYIGSTVSTLSHRKGQHVAKARKYPERFLYINPTNILFVF